MNSNEVLKEFLDEKNQQQWVDEYRTLSTGGKVAAASVAVVVGTAVAVTTLTLTAAECLIRAAISPVTVSRRIFKALR